MRRLSIIIALCAVPSWGAIARTGVGVGTSTSISLSATATGDLQVFYSYRQGSATAPTCPSGWTCTAGAPWTASNATGSTRSYRIGCRVAASSGDTGPWSFTNATNTSIASYSGTAVTTTAACATTGLIPSTASFGNSTTPSYATITMSQYNDWVVGFIGSSASGLTCTPSGMTNVAGGTSGEVGLSDTNAAVNAWATTTCTQTTSQWAVSVIEILHASTCSGTAYGAFTCVTTGRANAFTNTVNLAFTSITAGDLLVLRALTTLAPTAITVTTSSGCTGATWTLGTQVNTSTTNASQWAYGSPSGTGACTVTVAQAAATFVEVDGFVIHGSSNVIDGSSAVDDGFVTNPTTPSITPGTNGDFVIATVCNVNQPMGPYTLSGSFTDLLGGGANFNCNFAAFVQSTAAPISSTWTVAADSYHGATFAFKASGGAAAPKCSIALLGAGPC